MAESSDETGGPAFPTGRIPDPNDMNRVLWPRSGMMLRDYFAGQAIAAVIRQCGGGERDNGEGMTQMFARKSYALADAMLAERAKGR